MRGSRCHRADHRSAGEQGVSCRRAGRGADGRFQRAYDGITSTLCVARRDLVGWLAARGFDEDLRDRAALVLSELATNAVQAAPGRDYDVRVHEGRNGSAVVTVTSHTDYGRPPPRDQWGPVTPLALRGRGLLIVDELADEVCVDIPGRHTIVVTATLRSMAPGPPG